MITIDTITLRNLTTGYRVRHHEEKIITKNINAVLRTGELTCLLGPNGAGKSTLLRTLSGFIPPVSGDILLEGTSIEEFSSETLAKKISIVLTDKLLVPDMCLKQLVGLGRSPYTNFWGHYSSKDEEIIYKAIRTVGIEHLSNRDVSTLSDGERQKALIAKALAQQPPIILLDEPTAFLDYPSKVEIMLLLSKLARKEGKTIFLSTHDLDLALELADIVWLIDRDKGVITGAPEDLAISGDLRKYFRSDEIEFNQESGTFHINRKSIGKIRISGDGISLKMLVKALHRVGYDNEIVDKDSDIFVSPEGKFFYRDRQYENIYSLLKEII